MKKILSAFLALLCCVPFLWACEVSEPQSTDQQSISSHDWDYCYNNMQKRLPSGDFMPYGNDILFRSWSHRLYAYNLETGAVSLFCKDATCDHQNRKCAEHLFQNNLEAYDGMVYARTVDGGIIQMDDGRFHSTEWLEDVDHFFHSDGNLYIRTEDNSLIRQQDSIEAPEVIIPEYTGYWESIFGDYLYFSSGSDMYRLFLCDANAEPQLLAEDVIPLYDGNTIYYSYWGGDRIYRCDMDGSNTELLMDVPTNTGRAGFDENYFYYLCHTTAVNDPHPSGEVRISLYRFPKENPDARELIAELPHADGCIYTVPGSGKIFVDCTDLNNQQVEDAFYVMNCDGSDLQRLELPEA